MVMIVQLILLLRVYAACVDVVVSVIGLLAGEDSSTIADDVVTGGVDHRTMLVVYPHRRRHRNTQLRTISTTKVRMHYCLSPIIETAM